MRVNDAVTYDVSQGHDVKFVGMTNDGSKVYFTSEEQLTSSDTDSSTDLYMWSEATNTDFAGFFGRTSGWQLRCVRRVLDH